MVFQSSFRNKKTPTTRMVGQYAESLAKDFLITRGLHFITQNYQCRLGEIDLIMRDGEALVFVEVRYRARQDFGGPLASITPIKIQRLIKAAEYYLLRHGLSFADCRFDLVLFTLNSTTKTPTFEWIKNVIQA